MTVSGMCLSLRSKAWLSDFASLRGPHLRFSRLVSDRSSIYVGAVQCALVILTVG